MIVGFVWILFIGFFLGVVDLIGVFVWDVLIDMIGVIVVFMFCVVVMWENLFFSFEFMGGDFIFGFVFCCVSFRKLLLYFGEMFLLLVVLILFFMELYWFSNKFSFFFLFGEKFSSMLFVFGDFVDDFFLVMFIFLVNLVVCWNVNFVKGFE